MKTPIATILVMLVFVFQMPLMPSDTVTVAQPVVESHMPDLVALAQEFGGVAPVMVRLSTPLRAELIEEMMNLGIAFTLGSPEDSRIGAFYLLDGTPETLQELTGRGLIEDMMSQTSARHLYSTRDVSIPEINADDVWKTIDSLDRNVTGEGLLIADLDSGVDWRHPDLWFPGTVEYNWIDSLPNAVPNNASDYVDLNNDSAGTANETMYIIDLDGNGLYDVKTDWLWVDNVSQDGIPQTGEPFFVSRDSNSNGLLNLGEKLVMLTAPKTKYIVQWNSSTDEVVSWDRGNLTSSTHVDSDGHGTAVSGILLGGQIGYRQYVGVAPSAELMMIRVIASDDTWLTMEAALTWAFNHGADVILTEIGSWTYEYLDGSSGAETAIDTIVASGVPVISPGGNLGGKTKHALFTAQADTPRVVDFSIPPPDGVTFLTDINNVYMTVLSRNTTDFWSCNFSLVFNLATWGGPMMTLYLHPNSGYLNFAGPGDSLGWGLSSLTVKSFISVSSRSTSMLGIWISGTGLPTTNAAPWHQFNVTAPQITTFHAYVSDDRTSWSGGAVWKSDISNDYLICWPSTADSALSVASYRTRNLVSAEVVGDIASFSSRGPRVDEVLKQGVAAPGGFDVISDYTNASAWSNWYNAGGILQFSARYASYRLFSGTSASGPHVAGCAALMLQLNASAGSDVASIIETTASSDGFTGTVPNNVWGYGKLDAFAAISTFDLEGPSIHGLKRSPAQVEYYQQVVFEANVTDMFLDAVFLKYEIGGWTSQTYLDMSLQPSGNYTVQIGPFAYSSNVYYSVYANDTSSRSAETSFFNFTVGDSIEPWVGNVQRNATTPGASHAVLVSIDASEPLLAAGIDSVYLNYSTDDWGTFTVVLLSQSGSTYSGVIPGVPLGTTVRYIFYANDTAGNVNTTAELSYTTVTAEENPPDIGTPVHSPLSPNSTQTVLVRVNVTDDTAVDTVILSYFNGTQWVNITMSIVGGEYQAVIPGLPAGTVVTYCIYAVDMLGNWATTSDYVYTVQSGMTTTTTPTSTTTSTPTTAPTTPTPDRLLLLAMLGIVIILAILCVLSRRRRT